MKQIGKIETELSKRFYLDGLEIFENCPKCERECKFDGQLDYPTIGKEEEISFSCHHCDSCFCRKIILHMNIEVVGDIEILED